MSTQNEFEYRRRERRRRERLRKKRIRAVLLLIILIGIIVLICTAISAVIRGNSEKDNLLPPSDNAVTDVNATPAATIEPQSAQAGVIPTPAEENNLIEIIADAGQLKHCYLTFDDGPTENITPQILDILRRYNVKATFFEVGSLIEANPDMARRVYEEGHLIANHSNGHNYDKLYASNNSFITEILDCENQIKSVMNGEEIFKLMRFPGGSYNSGDHSSQKQIYKKLLADNGYYYCDWNCLNGDAEGRVKNAEQLLEYLKESMIGFNNIIVLMHDASTKQATVDALPSIIEHIASQGYTFHRLDDIDYHTQTSAADTGGAADTDSVNGASSTNSTSSES